MPTTVTSQANVYRDRLSFAKLPEVMDIPNPGIDAEKLLDKAASVKVASSLMGGWTVAE